VIGNNLSQRGTDQVAANNLFKGANKLATTALLLKALQVDLSDSYPNCGQITKSFMVGISKNGARKS
jgi:hypothetical protein